MSARIVVWLIAVGFGGVYLGGAWAQDVTPLAPTPAIEGEDPEVLKVLLARWEKLDKPARVSGIVVA